MMSRNKLAALASLLLVPAALLFVQISCATDGATWAPAPTASANARADIETQFAARFCTSQYRSQSDIMRCLGHAAR